MSDEKSKAWRPETAEQVTWIRELMADAFAAGNASLASCRRLPELSIEYATKAIPMPLVERPRVETVNGIDYQVIDGVLQARSRGSVKMVSPETAGEWLSLHATYVDIRKILTLFDQPTERVPADQVTEGR